MTTTPAPATCPPPSSRDAQPSTSVTSDKPLRLMHVPKPRKSSAEAARSTVRKKARVMEEVRDRVSGGDPGVLLREELRRVPRDELRSMLHQLKFDQVVIPSGHQLEAKVKIGLNYNQLGKLRSWLKMYNISMESERLTRRAARERLTAYDMHAETLPFCVKGAKKDGSDPTKVQLLPCAYISPVGAAIFDYLEKCQESECLTWHGGKIPQDEIWVKVGGDHGGGSFKLTFQLLNRDHPNSRQNTAVFSIFEAKDSRENLMLAIGRYAQELGDLQGSKWRAKDGKEHTMRVFGTGDYAFLCLWYGLSGASAVHPCLWCDITKMEMNNPESEDRSVNTTRFLTYTHLCLLLFAFPDKAIKDFMSYYRSNVPNGTVPIKMHMLEDHVVPCIRRWGFGLGFMAEQGVEHVHALFNSLARPTCTIPDPVARLKSTLTSHLIGVCPTNTIG
ncbi:uncharacterized protein LOC118418271 [Branchiostoma floridae]|uniref:Uncharacterized protein LOC118418271 n=1 Tax=Branchiostoma floridae TaxID=7739 RepID=A0A9J7LDI3_BRAFL|nr:uncharacterized protein LOC118418271 [Branchiostoma floridae]